jgi:hypothetical protein
VKVLSDHGPWVPLSLSPGKSLKWPLGSYTNEIIYDTSPRKKARRQIVMSLSVLTMLNDDLISDSSSGPTVGC